MLSKCLSFLTRVRLFLISFLPNRLGIHLYLGGMNETEIKSKPWVEIPLLINNTSDQFYVQYVLISNHFGCDISRRMINSSLIEIC